ncbi:hypothetical protein DITRI_Ditri09bG0138000 [Diplodiscus trichospermus]
MWPSARRLGRNSQKYQPSLGRYSQKYQPAGRDSQKYQPALGRDSQKYQPGLGRGSQKYQPGWGGKSRASNSYANPVETKRLNPYAKAWVPTIHRAPLQDRCLFITFSNGFPLTEAEITRFFTYKYGDCIEKVYVHWPRAFYRERTTPKFGKVTFKSSFIPQTITNCGKKQSKFMVNGKPLWCKKFDPNKTKPFWGN